MRILPVLVLCAACGADSGSSIVWSAGNATLTADDFTATVEGVTFHGVPDATVKQETSGDEISVEWTESGYAERFHLGFAMTSGGWTADDVRVYDLAGTDWHEVSGNFFAAPLGSSFHGDLDLPIDDAASVHFTNATVSPFGAR